MTLLIKCIKLSKRVIIFSTITIVLLGSLSCAFLFLRSPSSTALENSTTNLIENTIQNNISLEENTTNVPEENKAEEKSYIKWFEFKVSYDVLVKTSQLDINSHTKNEDIKYNWIELISYLACKYGNDFKKFKQSDLDALVSKLKKGETMESITKNMKLYSYYYEGYESVLSQFIGEYEIQKPSNTKTSNNKNSTYNNIAFNNKTSNNTTSNTSISNNTGSNTMTATNEYPFTKVYGIKSFHPLAQNYSYSHYDDFGNSRSYGYKRLHFGNDLMGSIGTPVIAVESGIIEAVRLESIWWLESWYS